MAWAVLLLVCGEDRTLAVDAAPLNAKVAPAQGQPPLNSMGEPVRREVVPERGPAGPRGPSGVAGVSIITAIETMKLVSGATIAVVAKCPAGAVVAGCSAYSSHPYGVPYRFYPLDKGTCEASFFNISTSERSFEFRSIAHCVIAQ
jgi:hypothetical protein